MNKTFISVCLALIPLSGCLATSQPSHQPPANAISCPAKRPEMCTQQYDPVCATTDSGQQKTHANGCEACADKTVESFQPGACE